jgi:hypothetical protein
MSGSVNYIIIQIRTIDSGEAMRNNLLRYGQSGSGRDRCPELLLVTRFNSPGSVLGGSEATPSRLPFSKEGKTSEHLRAPA